MTRFWRIWLWSLVLVAFGGGTLGGAEQATEAEAVAVVVSPPPEHHEMLLRAVRERRLLHFTYNGFVRVFEPHAYGVGSGGEVVLHGYQVAGGSASSPPPGWRTFTVVNLSEVVLTSRRFSRARSDYAAEALTLDPVWAEVEAEASGDRPPATPRTRPTAPSP